MVSTPVLTKATPKKELTKQAKQYQKLQKRLEQLQDGQFSRRLEELRRESSRTTPEEMYTFLNPSQVTMAAESSFGWWAYVVEATRNALVLLPLTITWLSLGLAGVAYTENITIHKELGTEPFLQQWGEGFYTLKTVTLGPFKIPLLWHTTRLFTFAHVAFVDAVILGMLLVLTVVVYFLERHAYTRAAQLGAWVEKELYTLTGQSLHRWGKTPEDTQRALADKMTEAMTKLGNALEEVKKVLEKSQQDVTESVGHFKSAIDYQSTAVDRYIEGAKEVEGSVGELKVMFVKGAEVYEQLGTMLPEMEKQVEGLTQNQSNSAVEIKQAALDIRSAAHEMQEAAIYMQGGPPPARPFSNSGISGGRAGVFGKIWSAGKKLFQSKSKNQI